MTAAIKFDRVSKHYPYYHDILSGIKQFLFRFPSALKDIKSKKFQALVDISFEIQRGECVGFIGRNGAGKSTTLGLIAKVLKPSSGIVTVNGRVSPLLQLGGGFHHELTGRENIKLNGVILGLSRKEVDYKIDEIIDFSELGEFIEHPLRTYSSGMQARLGFSVIAHLKPDILLVDEVLGVGDASFQQKCSIKINEFRKNPDVTIAIVSHSLGQVEKLCDRVIWIENQRLHKEGDPKRILEEYQHLMTGKS